MERHGKEKSIAGGFGSLKDKVSAEDIVDDDSDEPYSDAKKDMTKIMCKKDGVEAKAIVLPKYEYVAGVPLENVKAFECPKCKEFIFTPEQVEEMEASADKLKAGQGRVSDTVANVENHGLIWKTNDLYLTNDHDAFYCIRDPALYAQAQMYAENRSKVRIEYDTFLWTWPWECSSQGIGKYGVGGIVTSIVPG